MTRTYRDVQSNKILFRKARKIAGAIMAGFVVYVYILLLLCQGR